MDNIQIIETEKIDISDDEVKKCEEITESNGPTKIPNDITCEVINTESIENEKVDINENEKQGEKICEKISETNGPKKVAMCTSMDTETVRGAYDDVRADNSETQWAVFKFEGPRIICSLKGTSFEEFREQFSETERAFGYIRLQTGDELSKRQKFLFVTWVGPGVSVIQRAKMSTDKSIIKNIISNFAVELQLESLSEFDLPFFIESLNKASGANYGTGIRDA